MGYRQCRCISICWTHTRCQQASNLICCVVSVGCVVSLSQHRIGLDICNTCVLVSLPPSVVCCSCQSSTWILQITFACFLLGQLLNDRLVNWTLKMLVLPVLLTSRCGWRQLKFLRDKFTDCCVQAWWLSHANKLPWQHWYSDEWIWFFWCFGYVLWSNCCYSYDPKFGAYHDVVMWYVRSHFGSQAMVVFDGYTSRSSVKDHEHRWMLTVYKVCSICAGWWDKASVQ